VFAGMIGVTLFGLLFTPVFYVAVRALPVRAMTAWQEMRRRPALKRGAG
jgi:multidrug efflux pump